MLYSHIELSVPSNLFSDWNCRWHWIFVLQAKVRLHIKIRHKNQIYQPQQKRKEYIMLDSPTYFLLMSTIKILLVNISAIIFHILAWLKQENGTNLVSIILKI